LSRIDTSIDLVLANGMDSSSFIYHIAHPQTIDWATILDGLEKGGLKFERVEPSVWLEKVEAMPLDESPSKQMLPLWKKAVSCPFCLVGLAYGSTGRNKCRSNLSSKLPMDRETRGHCETLPPSVKNIS
jgi:hypothetical protein